MFRAPYSFAANRRPRLKQLATVGLIALVSTLTIDASSALAMRRVRAPYPGMGTAPGMEAAVRAAFPARLHSAALNVAWCESRGNPHARNGQYKGHFQIGRKEWARYGHGGNPYNGHDNAAAAYRYFQKAGWGPWECKP